jgi:hypothetical protein
MGRERRKTAHAASMARVTRRVPVLGPCLATPIAAMMGTSRPTTTFMTISKGRQWTMVCTGPKADSRSDAIRGCLEGTTSVTFG